MEQTVKRSKKERRLVIAAVLLLAMVALGVWLYPKLYWWLTVDSCLDRGGNWNEQTQACVGERH